MTIKRFSLLLPAMLLVSVVAASAAVVRVKADKTPMRVSASPTAAVVLELKAGATLELLDVYRDWYKVREPESKKEGFVLVKSVELLPATAGQKTSTPGAKPAAPATKAAPPPKKGDWTDHGYFSVNGFYEAGGSAFTQTQSWTSFAETASVSVAFPAANAGGFDVEGGYRVWRNMAIGIGVTAVNRSTTTTVTGSLPHPLYLNRPISLSGGLPASNSQVGIHIHAAWVVPMPPKVQLMLFGGPSIFSVKQTVLDSQGVGLTSAYPFESGSISSAKTTDATKTAIGFGAGLDVSYFFSRTIGVGGIARYARASVSFPVVDQPSVDLKAGGFQVGVGLRVRFPASKARPTPPAKPPTAQPKPPAKPEATKKK